MPLPAMLVGAGKLLGPAAMTMAANKFMPGDDGPDKEARREAEITRSVEGAMGVDPSASRVAETEPHSGFRDGGSKGQTLLAAGAGALAGAIKGFNDPENDDMADKIRGALKGGAAGGVAAGALKMSHDAIQEPGGGLKAGLAGAVSAGAASYLDKDGPGPIKSAMFGFGAGSTSNLAHDELTEAGHGTIADGLAGTGLGAAGGYVLGGDAKSAGIGALGGAAAGGLDSYLNRNDMPVVEGAMPGMIAQKSPLEGLQERFGGEQLQADQGFEMQ